MCTTENLSVSADYFPICLVSLRYGVSNSRVQEHKQEMIDMMTDSIFLYGTHRTIKHMVNFGKQIFQYVLTYQGRFSLANVFGIPTMGVCHADDLQYLFDPAGKLILTLVLPDVASSQKWPKIHFLTRFWHFLTFLGKIL